jgi:tetratricopeptide (TPR) repeat protein
MRAPRTQRVYLRLASACAWLALSLASVAATPSSSAAQAKKSHAAATASPAGPSDEVARGLFQAGKAAYEAGNYTDALSFFEQAHDRSGRPELLFNIGQAADRLRQDDKAIEALRAYVAQLPNAANRAEVEARIRALEHAIEERNSAAPAAAAEASPSPELVPSPEQTAQRAAPAGTELAAPQTEAAASKPVTKQWWFWTGIGAVVLGGTAVALAVALGGDDAGHAPYYEGNGGSLQGP